MITIKLIIILTILLPAIHGALLSTVTVFLNCLPFLIDCSNKLTPESELAAGGPTLKEGGGGGGGADILTFIWKLKSTNVISVQCDWCTTIINIKNKLSRR